jgi:hypothetical protein
MWDDTPRTRRGTIGRLATALSGVLFASGPAAAEEREPLSSKLTLKNGEVVVEKASTQEFTADDNLLNVDVETEDEILDYAAALLNRGVQKGHFAVAEREGKVVAKSLVSGSRGDVGVECGTDDLSWTIGVTQTDVTLRMDDSTTEDVRLALIGSGGITAAVGLAISASGIASVPGAVVSILGVALAAVSDIIGVKNDGCGVIITHTKYYSPLRPAETNISAQ